MATTNQQRAADEAQVRPVAPTDELSDEEQRAAARQANRFDIRRTIGGVFAVYGLVLTLMGIFGSHHVKTKAAGINIDLWTGIGMLIFAGLMIFWALARPVMPEARAVRDRESGRIGRAAAT